MKKIYLLFLVLVWLIYPKPSYALSCVPLPFSEKFTSNVIIDYFTNDYVFTGIIEDMSDPQDYIWFGTNHKVKIKVTNVYKGSLPNNIETRSYLDVKGEYLFFANETEKSGISLRERGVCSPRSPSKLIEYAGNNLYFVKVLSFYKMIILIFTMGLSVLFFKVITKNIKNKKAKKIMNK